MKRLLSVFTMVALLFSLTGCVFSTSEAEERIEKYIAQRYGAGFEILGVEKGRFNPYGGWVVPYRWTATVAYPERGITFLAEYSNEDKQVRDYYAQALYEKELLRTIEGIFNSYPDFEVSGEMNIKWLPSPDGWDPAVSFEDAFVDYALFKLDAELRISEKGAVGNAADLLRLFTGLRAERNEIRLEIRLISECGEAYLSCMQIPREHQNDLQQLRNDLMTLGEYAQDEVMLQEVLGDFLASHPFVESSKLDWSCQSGFIIEIILSDELTEGKAEAVFALCRQLINAEIFGGVLIFNSEGERRRVDLTDECTLEVVQQALSALSLVRSPSSETE